MGSEVCRERVQATCPPTTTERISQWTRNHRGPGPITGGGGGAQRIFRGAASFPGGDGGHRWRGGGRWWWLREQLNILNSVLSFKYLYTVSQWTNKPIYSATWFDTVNVGK